MAKAFLSHSSLDKKTFIDPIANKLGSRKVLYDRFSFEEGEQNLSEILKHLDRTDLFVLFISNNSLDSDWVIREITETKYRLEEGDIKKFYPIIIDKDILYTDPRIPEWIKINYNLQPILRISVIVNRINNKLIEINHLKHPKQKELQQLFVGRNKETEILEERLDDFEKKSPTALIVSGLSNVGRRSFLYNGLKKVNIIDSPVIPISVALDRNISIEDFILKLNDMGSIDNIEYTKNLSNKTIEEKIDIIHEFMDEAVKYKQIIFLLDDGAIVKQDRTLANWFVDVIDKYKDTDQPLFCIASRYQCNHKVNNNEKFFWMNVRELNIKERRRLLKKVLDIYSISLLDKDFNDICSNLHGYPHQARFAVELIDSDKLKCNIPDIIVQVAEYNSNKVQVILQKYESNQSIQDLLRLLAQFEIVTKDYLIRITGNDNDIDIINQLYYENIVDLVGDNSEIIKLSDIVKDYIKRNRLDVNIVFEENIKKIVSDDIRNEKYKDMDSSDLIFTMKEGLKSKEDYKIKEEYLIPSHYIRCMKDLYYSRGSLDRVIELADIILEKSDYIVPEVIRDVRYYLCLALAKRKDSRLVSEVQHIRGDEHAFLLGFYYRHLGRYREALEKFDSLPKNKGIRQRANREIVQVLVQIEEYDKALELARNNYENNTNNQFHLQAYISCLINSENALDNQAEIEQKIKNLYDINSTQSKEMAETARALFAMKIKNDPVEAFQIIDDCIAMYPENYYPLLGKADIAILDRNKPKLEEAIKSLEESFASYQYSRRTLDKYKAYNYAIEGEYSNAIKAFEPHLRNYTEEGVKRFRNKIKRMYDNNETTT